MTRTGFWKDDEQVCREEVTKRWSRKKLGIHITVVTLNDTGVPGGLSPRYERGDGDQRAGSAGPLRLLMLKSL